MPVVEYKNPALHSLVGEHLLPLWDERLRLRFAPKDRGGGQSLNSNVASQPYPLRQVRKANVSVDEAMLLLKECIKDNQGFFVQVSTASRFRVRFPYARYMRKGDKIFNLTTGEEYTITQVYNESTNEVLLSGRKAPRSNDRLRLHSDNEIFVNHGFPRSLSKTYKFSETGVVGDKPAPWNDTITFLIIRSEPGSVSDTPPFQGTRQLKPQFRESFDDPSDPVMMVSTSGWFFDNLVQFDCWARTNAEAVSLIQWFEDFMFRHTWIFELYGVSKVLYWRRDEDMEVPIWRNDITKRTVLFYFRTERVFSYSSRKLSHMSMDVSVDMNDEPTPERFLESIPEPSTSAAWPEPTSSIDVDLYEQ